LLICTYRVLPFSDLSYLLLFLFFCMHEWGAHYKYTDVPLGEWMKTKGLTPAPLGWEIYISDPGQTKPEEVKTEVYLMAEPDKK